MLKIDTTKTEIPPPEELDGYELELLNSGDPTDRLALLFRIELRRAGVNPDSDDWYISDSQQSLKEKS